MPSKFELVTYYDTNYTSPFLVKIGSFVMCFHPIGLSGEILIVTQFILQTFLLGWVGGETFMIISWMDVEALVQVVHYTNKESLLKMLLVWRSI